MPRSDQLREEVGVLRETIQANDGTNMASGPFARKVDQLISDFYDDIGELTALRLHDILDLFLIKVLYVDRRSRDARALFYLARLLERYIDTREMRTGDGRGFVPYLSDLMAETAAGPRASQNHFETYRRYGDNAMFISGVFPQSIGRRRGAGRMGGAATVDRQYFITVGRSYYEKAAAESLAELVQLRETLRRLAHWFDLYVDALNDVSGRYVMGIDMRVIADKMLDAFNRYRETHDPAHLERARTYAALMKLDGRQWPALDELAPQLGDPDRYF